MLFPTFEFFAFFVVVLALNWILKAKPLIWRLFLLAISYFFYATWNSRFVLLIFLISVFNFFSASFIDKAKEEKRKKFLLAGTIIINVLALAFFKYYNFFRDSAEIILNKMGLTNNLLFLQIVLPIGLSFYILRVISYNIDVFRQKIAPEKSYLNFAIYVAFFPQLLAGPIMRAGDFLPQLKSGGAKTIANLEKNFVLILGGLFKKIVIAGYLTTNIVSDVFAVPQNHSQLAVLLAMYAYAVVIYCDFSAYSDMAIGIAGLMGFKSPINFNASYSAVDFRDFWRRWHITFSEWLRDYVYIPLGGNRKGRFRTYFNSLITMLVSGLWHGAGLNYLAWGLLHGLGLVFSNIRNEALQKWPNKARRNFEKLFSWFLTFNFICFFWIFFGAANLQNAFDIIKQLFNWRTGIEPIDLYVVGLIILSFIIFALGRKIQNLFISLINFQRELPPFLKILSSFVSVLIIALLVILALKLGPDIIPSFIYFKF